MGTDDGDWLPQVAVQVAVIEQAIAAELLVPPAIGFPIKLLPAAVARTVSLQQKNLLIMMVQSFRMKDPGFLNFRGTHHCRGIDHNRAYLAMVR